MKSILTLVLDFVSFQLEKDLKNAKKAKALLLKPLLKTKAAIKAPFVALKAKKLAKIIKAKKLIKAILLKKMLKIKKLKAKKLLKKKLLFKKLLAKKMFKVKLLKAKVLEKLEILIKKIKKIKGFKAKTKGFLAKKLLKIKAAIDSKLAKIFAKLALHKGELTFDICICDFSFMYFYLLGKKSKFFGGKALLATLPIKLALDKKASISKGKKNADSFDLFNLSANSGLLFPFGVDAEVRAAQSKLKKLAKKLKVTEIFFHCIKKNQSK